MHQKKLTVNFIHNVFFVSHNQKPETLRTTDIPVTGTSFITVICDLL
jgi:hypothetical protein